MGLSGERTDGVQRSIKTSINVTPLIDVLLVLLIIFLVVMPLMLKVETLDIPRTIDDPTRETADPSIQLEVHADLSVGFSDGSSDHFTPIAWIDIARTLRPKVAAMTLGHKAVFVDFDDAVPWSEVISTVDTIRSLATDADREEIRVALKIRDSE